jgi:hypothetical protein
MYQVQAFARCNYYDSFQAWKANCKVNWQNLDNNLQTDEESICTIITTNIKLKNSSIGDNVTNHVVNKLVKGRTNNF